MSELERYGVAALAVTIILVLLVSLGGLASSNDARATRIPLPTASPPAASARPDEPLVVPSDHPRQDGVVGGAVAFAEQVRVEPEIDPAPSGAGRAMPATVIEASGTAGDKPASISRYVVQHGDTLAEIARKELGASRRWSEIVALNKGLAANHLKAGQELVLPGPKAARSPAPVAGIAAPPVAGGSVKKLERTADAVKIYTVEKDDTLESIAEKQLGDRRRWRDLYDLNRKRLKKPDRLFAGIKLQIPS